MKKKFNIGDTVAFDPDSFNKEFWNELSIQQKRRYYGTLYDFDNNKPYLFTFICEHSPQIGHCVLINMDNQKIETMRHTNNFRLVNDEEC